MSVATATAISIGTAAATAGTSLYSAHRQGNANRDATQAQSEATQKALDFERQKYGDLQTRIQPWISQGQSASSRMSELVQPGSGFGQAPASFVAPTGADVEADPGYGFRLAEGNRGVQRSSAAKGSLLSGGTLKALAKYNQEYASNEYGNVYGRKFAGYQSDVNNRRNSESDYWARLLGLSSTGYGAATQGQGA